MLKTRVLTGSVLIALLIISIFYATNPIFTLVTGIIFLIAVWEWTRLSGFKSLWGRALAFFAIPGLAFVLFAGLQALGVTGLYQTGVLRRGVIYSILAFWSLVSIGVSIYPKGASLYHSKLFNLIIGIFVLIPPWVTLIALQAIRPSWVLYPLVLVWVADTAAYFVGKRFGKHLLAPQLSPGKTWEGVLGAFAGTLIVSVTGYFLLVNHTGSFFIPWLLLNIITVLFSIVGDLFESLFKREQQLKDSGSLLPGHGGVLDRIDSLTAALPIFVIGLMFF